ncbi:UNVERIFIED_CONTAM: hypothetical protein FKN15_028625 [Acipenser sinensis]
MAAVINTVGKTEPPNLALTGSTRTSNANTDLLEQIINRTTLSTQRATHRHILVIGDTFQKTKKKKKIASVSGGEQERGALPEQEEEEGSEASALCRLEEELQELIAGAEQERELALQQQKQVQPVISVRALSNELILLRKVERNLLNNA